MVFIGGVSFQIKGHTAPTRMQCSLVRVKIELGMKTPGYACGASGVLVGFASVAGHELKDKPRRE
jgi:hypothetical protein